jgi:hypothetical protein
VTPGSLANLAESAFFCPYPTCDIVYFDVFDRSLRSDRIKKQVYPKDPNAPICGCFGLTLDDIELDISEGVVTRCKAIIERAKSDDARCSIMSVTGQSCIPEVQRQYIKRRQVHHESSD